MMANNAMSGLLGQYVQGDSYHRELIMRHERLVQEQMLSKYPQGVGLQASPKSGETDNPVLLLLDK